MSENEMHDLKSVLNDDFESKLVLSNLGSSANLFLREMIEDTKHFKLNTFETSCHFDEDHDCENCYYFKYNNYLHTNKKVFYIVKATSYLIYFELLDFIKCNCIKSSQECNPRLFTMSFIDIDEKIRDEDLKLIMPDLIQRPCLLKQLFLEIDKNLYVNHKNVGKTNTCVLDCFKVLGIELNSDFNIYFKRRVGGNTYVILPLIITILREYGFSSGLLINNSIYTYDLSESFLNYCDGDEFYNMMPNGQIDTNQFDIIFTLDLGDGWIGNHVSFFTKIPKLKKLKIKNESDYIKVKKQLSILETDFSNCYDSMNDVDLITLGTGVLFNDIIVDDESNKIFTEDMLQVLTFFINKFNKNKELETNNETLENLSDFINMSESIGCAIRPYKCWIAFCNTDLQLNNTLSSVLFGADQKSYLQGLKMISGHEGTGILIFYIESKFRFQFTQVTNKNKTSDTFYYNKAKIKKIRKTELERTVWFNMENINGLSRLEYLKLKAKSYQKYKIQNKNKNKQNNDNIVKTKVKLNTFIKGILIVKSWLEKRLYKQKHLIDIETSNYPKKRGFRLIQVPLMKYKQFNYIVEKGKLSEHAHKFKEELIYERQICPEYLIEQKETLDVAVLTITKGKTKVEVRAKDHWHKRDTTLSKNAISNYLDQRHIKRRKYLLDLDNILKKDCTRLQYLKMKAELYILTREIPEDQYFEVKKPNVLKIIKCLMLVEVWIRKPVLILKLNDFRFKNNVIPLESNIPKWAKDEYVKISKIMKDIQFNLRSKIYPEKQLFLSLINKFQSCKFFQGDVKYQIKINFSINLKKQLLKMLMVNGFFPDIYHFINIKLHMLKLLLMRGFIPN